MRICKSRSGILAGMFVVLLLTSVSAEAQRGGVNVPKGIATVRFTLIVEDVPPSLVMVYVCVDTYTCHWEQVPGPPPAPVTGLVVTGSTLGGVTVLFQEAITPRVSDPPYATQTITRDVDVRRWTATADLPISVDGPVSVTMLNACGAPYYGGPLAGGVCLQLQLGITTNPATPYHVGKEAALDGTPIQAKLALGSIFTVELLKKVPDARGGPATITPVSSLYSISADSIAPAFHGDFNLFTGSTLVKLSGPGNDPATSLKYAAVHLGKVSFTLLPIAIAGAPAVTVDLEIVRPAKLGAAPNEFDARIIEAAHETGLLPQILKGQIRQESNFDRESFRYEPCSWDFASISREDRLIDEAPYNEFAMDGALALPGLQDTLELRGKLFVPDGTTGPSGRIGIRPINRGERGVTAKNIWVASDIRPGTNRGERWTEQGCEARRQFLKRHTAAQFIDALDFVAQTPTSSSYGFMQVMFPLVVDFHWNVDDPQHPGHTTQSPRYLVDTDEAIALARGGSMLIGSEEDVLRYWNDWAPLNEPLVFPTQSEFFDSFKDPLRMYTGGGAGSEDYGTNIVAEYQFNYIGVEPAAIFP